MRTMEKGIVVEKSGRNLIVLTPEGEFKKVAVSGGEYRLGQEIEFNVPRVSSVYRFGAIAAAVVLLLLVPVFVNLMEMSHKAYAYVQLDINPGVEFTINRYDRIIDVRALNSDGQKVLEGFELNGKNLEEGIRYFTSKSYEMGYVSEENKNHIIVTTVMEGEENPSLEKTVEEAVNQVVDEKNIPAQVNVLNATKEIRAEAEKSGISSGKLLLLLEANSEGMDIDIEDMKSLSISEVFEKEGRNAEDIIKHARKTREEMNRLLEKQREKTKEEKLKKDEDERDNKSENDRDNEGNQNREEASDKDRGRDDKTPDQGKKDKENPGMGEKIKDRIDERSKDKPFDQDDEDDEDKNDEDGNDEQGPPWVDDEDNPEKGKQREDEERENNGKRQNSESGKNRNKGKSSMAEEIFTALFR